MSRLKLAVLASHPIQYQAPLYRALARRDDIDLKVFFCWDFGVKTTRDPGFGREIRWDVPLLDGYAHEFVKNHAARPGTDHFLGLCNPDAPRAVLAFRPDAIVVHGYAHLTELLVMGAARARRVPVLLRAESNLLPRRPAWLRAVKRATLVPLMRGLGGGLAIGTLSAQYFAHYGMPRGRIFIAPYSVDNSFFQDRLEETRAEARAWRQQLGIPADDLVVLYAAKLLPVKAPADLLRAFGARQRRGVHLLLVGDGPLRPELSALAQQQQGASIHFLGFVNQRRMPAAYALGDVFVLPSNFEPWGLAVNEAMNLGLPVIASDQVAAATDLVSPANGWVFPAGDVAALAGVLDQALADRPGLRLRGEGSLARIANWDIPHTAEAYVHAARTVSRSYARP